MQVYVWGSDTKKSTDYGYVYMDLDLDMAHMGTGI